MDVLHYKLTNLENRVGNNDQERVGQVEQKPDLDRLDFRRARERGGDREVDRGQHHHARDVTWTDGGGPDDAESIWPKFVGLQTYSE